MAGSVGRIVEDIDDRHSGKKPIRKILIEWTSDDAAGNLSKSLGKVNGRIIALETKPGAPAPIANYDVTVEDELGYDVLEGLGADRSDANTEKALIILESALFPMSTAYYGEHPAVCGTLTFKIANAGNSKKGTAILYVE